MSRPKNILIADGEWMVTAWAEYASGPGWINRPVYVLIEGRTGRLRVECLQPSEQSAEVQHLHRIAALVREEFMTAVRRQVVLVPRKGGAE